MWESNFYAPGSFKLSVPADKEIVALLKEQCFLTKTNIASENECYDQVMIIERVVMTEDEIEGRKLSLAGRSADAIFSYRVMTDIQIRQSGYVILPMTSDIYDSSPPILIQLFFTILFKESPIHMRNITWVHIGSEIESSYEPVYASFFGENFLNVVNDYRQKYKIGIQSRLIRAKYLFEEPQDPEEWFLEFVLYEPSDYTRGTNVCIISAQNGDIASSEYTYNKTKEVSSVIALGTTEDEPSEEFAELEGEAEGIYRIEQFMDLSTVKSENTSKTVQELVSEQALKSLKAPEEKISITESDNPHFKALENYKLGDIVIARDDFGNYGRVRCVKLTETYDRNGYSIIPTFDEWEPINLTYCCKNGMRYITSDNKQIIVKGE